MQFAVDFFLYNLIQPGTARPIVPPSRQVGVVRYQLVTQYRDGFFLSFTSNNSLMCSALHS